MWKEYLNRSIFAKRAVKNTFSEEGNSSLVFFRFARVFSFREVQVSYFFCLFQKSRYVLPSPPSKSFLRYLRFLSHSPRLFTISCSPRSWYWLGLLYNNTCSCTVDSVDTTCLGSCTYTLFFFSLSLVSFPVAHVSLPYLADGFGD